MNKKIYFAASIRGGRVDATLYQRMIAYIKQTDTVLTEHIGKMTISLKAQTKAIDTHIYERDTEWLWGLYLGLTLLGIGLYCAGGMTLFDSVCHSMTTTATGGYSSHQESIAAFHSPYLEGNDIPVYPANNIANPLQ